MGYVAGMANTVKNASDIPEETLKDILVTAVEGGVNYWAASSNYDPDEGRVLLTDAEDPGEDEWHVDLDVIRKGIEEIASNSDLAPRFADQCRALAAGEEDVDFDADTADVIVQVGLFDEVTFG